MNLFNLLVNGIDPPPGLGEENTGSGLITLLVIVIPLAVIALLLLIAYSSHKKDLKKSKKIETHDDQGEITKMEENKEFKIYPVICPRCGGRDLVFKDEKKRATFCRIFNLIIGIIIFVISLHMIQDFIQDQPTQGGGWLILLLVLFGCIGITQIVIESETQVQMICKTCGKTWILEDKQ